MDRRELPVDNERGQENTEQTPKAGPPWGFFLVLAAIVVVAIVYSVTIFALDLEDRTPETMFGAMAASFTVIGTLVGTYFGIKAGLDGQDKVRQTLARATDSFRQYSQDGSERDGDRKGRPPKGEQSITPELQELGREERVKQQGWEGGSV